MGELVQLNQARRTVSSSAQANPPHSGDPVPRNVVQLQGIELSHRWYGIDTRAQEVIVKLAAGYGGLRERARRYEARSAEGATRYDSMQGTRYFGAVDRAESLLKSAIYHALFGEPPALSANMAHATPPGLHAIIAANAEWDFLQKSHDAYASCPEGRQFVKLQQVLDTAMATADRARHDIPPSR